MTTTPLQLQSAMAEAISGHTRGAAPSGVRSARSHVDIRVCFRHKHNYRTSSVVSFITKETNLCHCHSNMYATYTVLGL